MFNLVSPVSVCGFHVKKLLSLLLILLGLPSFPASGKGLLFIFVFSIIHFQRLISFKQSPFLLMTPNMFTLLKDCMAFQLSGFEQVPTCEHLTPFFFRFQCLKTLQSWPQSGLQTSRGGSCSPWSPPWTPWSAWGSASLPALHWGCRQGTLV